MTDIHKKAWDNLLDRVSADLAIYMDDVSILQLTNEGVQKLITWLIDRGYKKDPNNPRFIYEDKK